MKSVASASALLLISLGGCASVQTGQTSDADPFEGFNRKMFAFNDALDRAILEPTAKGYRAVTTQPMRDGVSNALSNLGETVTFANEVLQGDLVGATGTMGRFVVNSTLGVAGLVDVATDMGIERSDEDFGQTLAVWGMDSGPYIVLPILNSTTPRDLFGGGVDTIFKPLTWAEFDEKDETQIGLGIIGTISSREKIIELVDDVREQQADPYTALRRNYVQSRNAAIRNGQENPNAYEDLPDYDEYWDEE